MIATESTCATTSVTTTQIDAKSWAHEAIGLIQADFQRSADTHLIKLDLPTFAGIDIYLKDESRHPTGSLKHRLARSLFLYALVNGLVDKSTPIVEASSGSTAVSEAYFARLIGVDFYAVMPKSTSAEKIKLIERYGGKCHFVDTAPEMQKAAEQLAASLGGLFMNQFKYAERATDWRGNNNIAESIFTQMQRERYPIPHTIVMSAGTGGTSATIGRYIRYQGHSTRLVVVDPEGSAFYHGYMQQYPAFTTGQSSRIEGIGRPTVEASFVLGVIDDMRQVEDAASVATMQWLYDYAGHLAGPSTGTNLYGLIEIAAEMRAKGETGALITLMCDTGERYLNTYYDDAWVAQTFGDISHAANELHQLIQGN